MVKHPALHGRDVAGSSRSETASCSSMPLTGFREAFFHKPVFEVEDSPLRTFFLNRMPASLSVVSSVPIAECLKRVNVVSAARKRNYTSPHLPIWTGVGGFCGAETGPCSRTLASGLG